MSGNRVLKQFSYFDHNLQCTVTTTTWLYGPLTVDYTYSEHLPSGFIRTRIESIPRSVGPHIPPVSPAPLDE